MSAFDEYKAARATMTTAGNKAEEIVKSIQKALEHLFRDWKDCYIADIGEIPEALTAIIDRHQRSPIHVNNFQWAQLQDCMAQYIDALAKARSQYNAMSQSDKDLLAPPPWTGTPR
jgi:hypothetical protein